MKTNIILISVLCCLSTACSDFLKEEPKGSLTPETFYQTASDLELASTALYIPVNAAFGQLAGLSTVYGGDDITVARAGNKISFSDFDTFQANSSNDRMTNWWNSFYAGIKSSNALINNYQRAVSATEDERNRAAGQAYFFRALSYFFLTRTWGEIPLITENTIDNTRKKAPVADIYALIVDDLQHAEAMLPDHWDGVRVQGGVDIAPTRGSAKALLANAYLTMAGWPLKQTDKYALAAAKAKEVIDQRATWGYDLVTDFEDLWLKEGKYNHEAVFGCYYNIAISEFVFENMNMSGPPSLAPGDEGGWDDGFSEITFYNNFPDGPRKDATFQSTYFVGGKTVDYTGTTTGHPYFMKYRDDDTYDRTTHVINNWIGSHTTFVIRYAEVLLTYAEAQTMATNADETAYAAINQVRHRAGLGDLTPGLSKEAFRNAVLQERGWEFAGAEPAARWFDLVRTETVGAAQANRNAKEPLLKGTPSDAEHTFYWAPIPINDTSLNPNL